ncbi:MAG: DUF4402 domain-containing protein [Pseudomonadota bacterium]|nr:DUF4402 domain-containing protein [Pseudomonadota bacterium]
MRFNFCLAALAATAVFASPALAQTTPTPPPVTDTATALARGLVLQPLTLTKDEDLDFGTILASTTLGDVTINANDGSRTVSGGVTQVTANPGGRAIFVGAGTVNQQVTLTLTPPADSFLLSAANDKILVSDLVFDSGGATRTIGTSGVFTVGVGGTFEIAAGQPNGEYEADFSVTAEYP